MDNNDFEKRKSDFASINWRMENGGGLLKAAETAMAVGADVDTLKDVMKWTYNSADACKKKWDWLMEKAYPALRDYLNEVPEKLTTERTFELFKYMDEIAASEPGIGKDAMAARLSTKRGVNKITSLHYYFAWKASRDNSEEEE